MKPYSNNLKRYYKEKKIESLDKNLDKEILNELHKYLTNDIKENIIKEVKKRKIYKIQVKDEIFYLKKFFNNSYKVGANFFSTPGERSYYMACHLKKLGIKAFEYFALMEDKTNFKLIADSIIISREFIVENFMDVLKEADDKKELLDKFIETYLSILKSDFHHKDPTFWNFGVKNNELVVMDIDSIRKFYFPSLFSKTKYVNSIAFLNFTLVKTVNREMRGIFTYQDRDYIILKILSELNYGKKELEKINKTTLKQSKPWLNKRKMPIVDEIEIQEGKINDKN